MEPIDDGHFGLYVLCPRDTNEDIASHETKE